MFGQSVSQWLNVLELNAAAAADDLDTPGHAGERPLDELIGRYPRLEIGVLVALHVVRPIGERARLG